MWHSDFDAEFPDYKVKLADLNRSAEQIIVIEDQHYFTNHAVVGSMLARNWGLPSHITQAIQLHHDHSIFTHANNLTTPTVCTLVSIQMVSEHIVAGFLNKPDDAEWHLAGKMAQDYLGISSEDISGIKEDALDELEENRSSH